MKKDEKTTSDYMKLMQKKYRERIGEEEYLKIKRANAKKGGEANKKRLEKLSTDDKLQSNK
jgi:hypothetical protein